MLPTVNLLISSSIYTGAFDFVYICPAGEDSHGEDRARWLWPCKLMICSSILDVSRRYVN